MTDNPIDTVIAQAARDQEVRRGREFAFTLVSAFLVLGLLALGKARRSGATVSFALALVFLLGGLVLPERLGPLRRAWMRAGEAIGMVTTPILMGGVYYLVLTPIAFVRRVRRRGSPTQPSGWHHREPLPPPSRMERQF